MLFIAERNVWTLWPLLCAMATGVDSTKIVASVMIETFIGHFSFFLLLNDSNFWLAIAQRFKFVIAEQSKSHIRIAFRGWPLNQS